MRLKTGKRGNISSDSSKSCTMCGKHIQSNPIKITANSIYKYSHIRNKLGPGK